MQEQILEYMDDHLTPLPLRRYRKGYSSQTVQISMFEKCRLFSVGEVRKDLTKLYL